MGASAAAVPREDFMSKLRAGPCDDIATWLGQKPTVDFRGCSRRAARVGQHMPATQSRTGNRDIIAPTLRKAYAKQEADFIKTGHRMLDPPVAQQQRRHQVEWRRQSYRWSSKARARFLPPVYTREILLVRMFHGRYQFGQRRGEPLFPT